MYVNFNSPIHAVVGLFVPDTKLNFQKVAWPEAL